MADSDSLDDILGSSVDATAKAGNKTGTAQPASGTDPTSSGMFSVSGSVNFDSTETQTIDSEAASELLGSEVGSDFGAGINPGAPGTAPGAMPSAQSGAPGAAPQTYGQTPGDQPGVGGQPPYGAGQPPYGNPGAAPQQNVYVMPTYNQMHVVGDKNKIVAGILGILLGGLGIHNFYLRNYTKAVVQLLLCTIGWIILIGPWIACTWGFIEGILILVSKPGSTWHRDGEGAELID